LPTYQYSCTECGHFFEQFQSFSEESLTVCPECEGRLRKVFNAVGVVFKGSGFYRTDSRGDKAGSGASSAGEGASTPAAASASSSTTGSTSTTTTSGSSSTSSTSTGTGTGTSAA
jgi:putative FmdB family regulatory protein